jgi:sterol desaturase/sphingolipid hydroxylase (fatty acid hydroxylase superfamily)
MHFILQHHLQWIFLTAILIEILIIQRQHLAYSWRETRASVGVAIGHFLSGLLFKAIPLTVYTWVWNFRIGSIELTQLSDYLWLFLGIEFCYYWYHRSTHRIRWFWATHLVHHSPEYFNLSVASRLGWTNIMSGHFIFFIPLVWLGFPPSAILIGISLNLLYQFWMHTELLPKFGILEWVFNTPSHHRAHHASNDRYIDCNYGGVLIVFDRLFGTFVEENANDPCRYGLTQPMRSNHPMTIAFSGWRSLIQDLSQAQSHWERLQYLILPPDWRPDRKID